MASQEHSAQYQKQLDLVTAKNEVARRFAGEDLDNPGWWEVEGEVGVTGFLYTVIYGNFKLTNPSRKLEFKGDLFGDVIAGTSTRGKALFTVPLEELVAGSVLTIVTTRGAVAAGCLVEWSRDFKHLGTFVGTGWGLFGGDAVGGGQFKVIGD